MQNQTDKKINFASIHFLKSATLTVHFPEDVGAEVAFAGRSNAGKSSAINAITSQNKLARTSKTPGRTQLINFFAWNEYQRLVDIPGYGFADVPVAIQANWKQMLENYFESRNSLHGIVLLSDIRHPMRDDDWVMLEFAKSRSLPVLILLTKADKLSKSDQNLALFKTQQKIKAEQFEMTEVLVFSATKKMGVEAARMKIEGWLKYN